MNKIKIIGLGPAGINELTLGIYNLIQEHAVLYVRTADHPCVHDLKKENIKIHSFDSVYEKYNEDFEQVYPEIVEKLLELSKTTEVLYAVPGHPNVAEKTVQLLKETNHPVEVVGGKSFIDDMFKAVEVDPVEGFQLLDSFDMNPHTLQTNQHIIVMQVFDSFMAGEVKLSLMEHYPDEHEVYRVNGAGSAAEQVEKVKLYELDRFDGVHNLQSVYVPPLARDERVRSFSLLQEYADIIISDEGDTWINNQTNQSLLEYMKEETEEYIQAVEQEDPDEMAEELGDVLMQVVYQAKIAENSGLFALEDVVEALNRKLRRRHPHVFDGVKAETPEEVDALWQAIKKQERRGEI